MAQKLLRTSNTHRQIGVLPRAIAADQLIALHMRALAIRLRLGIPQAVIDLRSLATYRRELGHGTFGHLISSTGSDPELISALGQLLESRSFAQRTGPSRAFEHDDDPGPDRAGGHAARAGSFGAAGMAPLRNGE